MTTTIDLVNARDIQKMTGCDYNTSYRLLSTIEANRTGVLHHNGVEILWKHTGTAAGVVAEFTRLVTIDPRIDDLLADCPEMTRAEVIAAIADADLAVYGSGNEATAIANYVAFNRIQAEFAPVRRTPTHCTPKKRKYSA